MTATGFSVLNQQTPMDFALLDLRLAAGSSSTANVDALRTEQD